jgi:hypothetical protein
MLPCFEPDVKDIMKNCAFIVVGVWNFPYPLLWVQDKESSGIK